MRISLRWRCVWLYLGNGRWKDVLPTLTCIEVSGCRHSGPWYFQVCQGHSALWMPQMPLQLRVLALVSEKQPYCCVFSVYDYPWRKRSGVRRILKVFKERACVCAVNTRLQNSVTNNNMGFELLRVASFIGHKIIWIYKVQYGYLKKNCNFFRTMKRQI